MPCDYSKYPRNWKTEIVPRILKRAGEYRSDDRKIVVDAKCEWCGVENHTLGYRTMDGRFWPLDDSKGNEIYKVVKIVLTIAHLDHDENNWNVSDDRLKALCQKCHNSYDVEHRRQTRARKHREQTNQPALIE